MESPQNPEELRTQMFSYWGTFSLSMITMTELTLGNFVPVTRFLCENVGELYGYAILAYKLIVGFAIVRIISGVFIQETFETVASDNELMIVQKRRAMLKHEAKMKHLMSKADTSGDGLVSLEEFRKLFRDKQLKMWLAAQDIEVQDAGLLFDLIDDGDGELSCSELIHGMARLRGAAKSIDLYGLMHMVKNIICAVDSVDAKLQIMEKHWVQIGAAQSESAKAVSESLCL